jgi:hypothetical protein
MSISQHILSLQQHLAKLGLHPVPSESPGANDQSEIFKICFLNKYEMQRWKELQERSGEEDTPP